MHHLLQELNHDLLIVNVTPYPLSFMLTLMILETNKRKYLSYIGIDLTDELCLLKNSSLCPLMRIMKIIISNLDTSILRRIINALDKMFSSIFLVFYVLCSNSSEIIFAFLPFMVTKIKYQLSNGVDIIN